MAKKKEKIINARKINKMRCIVGLVICSIVIALTFVAILLNVDDFFSEGGSESGLGTLRMYTTLSNIVAAVAASLCIPFQIDGLRKNKYKLPHWIVTVMYIGVTGVAITFLFAISIISVAQGFVQSMFLKSNLFLHTINPIFFIILFTLAISDAEIKFKESYLAFIPLVIYCILYFIMVFVVHEWRDHYRTNTYVPWPLSLVLVLVVAFAATHGLRLLHNLTHKYVEQSIKRYYKKSPDYEFENVTDAVSHLAEIESRYYYKDDDIYIPVDIIKLLSERYKTSAVPIDILFDVYLEKYIENIKKQKKHL